MKLITLKNVDMSDRREVFFLFDYHFVPIIEELQDVFGCGFMRAMKEYNWDSKESDFLDQYWFMKKNYDVELHKQKLEKFKKSLGDDILNLIDKRLTFSAEFNEIEVLYNPYGKKEIVHLKHIRDLDDNYIIKNGTLNYGNGFKKLGDLINGAEINFDAKLDIEYSDYHKEFRLKLTNSTKIILIEQGYISQRRLDVF